MNAKPEQAEYRHDILKWGAVAAILAAAMAAFYFFSDLLLLYRVLMMVVGVAGSVAVAGQTAFGHAAWDLLTDSRVEFQKVVWPTRQESTQTTLAIAAMLIVVGIFLWITDFILSWGLERFVGIGG